MNIQQGWHHFTSGEAKYSKGKKDSWKKKEIRKETKYYEKTNRQVSYIADVQWSYKKQIDKITKEKSRNLTYI